MVEQEGNCNIGDVYSSVDIILQGVVSKRLLVVIDPKRLMMAKQAYADAG